MRTPRPASGPLIILAMAGLALTVGSLAAVAQGESAPPAAAAPAPNEAAPAPTAPATPAAATGGAPPASPPAPAPGTAAQAAAANAPAPAAQGENLVPPAANAPPALLKDGPPPPGVTVLPPAVSATPTKAPASIRLDGGKAGKPAPATDMAYGAYQRGHFKTALDLAVERADSQGDPVAMVLAGELLSQGYGVRQDALAARHWFEAAAAKGNADALFTLGSTMLTTGDAVQKGQAVEMLRQSAEKGNVAAAYNLGLVYLQGQLAPKEPAIAADWFRRAADKDQPDALYALATLYRDGNGVPRDLTEAARLLRRAADLGNAVATTELAIMVFNGNGVPRSEARGAELFRRAALAGNAIAQNRYARILSAGRGVPQDRIAAIAWHLTAKAQNLDDPMLDKLVSELTPEERAQVDARVKIWTVAQTQ